MDKRKPDIRVLKHRCTKASILKRHSEILERTDYILYGNGTPQDGLLFKVDLFIKDHDVVVKDISEIKLTVQRAIDTSAKTERMIEDFRSDEEQFEKGKQAILKLQSIEEEKKKDERNERRAVIGTVVKVAGVIIALITVLFLINSKFDKVIDAQKSIKADTKTTNEVLIPLGTERGLKTIVIDNDTTSTFK